MAADRVLPAPQALGGRDPVAVAFGLARPLATRLGPGIALFLGAAAVSLWQNSHVAVLWDLSWILNYSYRISIGQLPYRDFPFPYVPGTFVTQALLIKVFGAHYPVQIAYCALASGLSAALTFAILKQLLAPRLAQGVLVAFLLSLPLTVLGVYDVYPHPFYDPDACLWMLLALYALVRTEAAGFPAWRSVLAGALLVMPALFKQNLGAAFALAAGGATAVAWLARWEWKAARAAGLAAAGAAGILSIVGFTVHRTVGFHNLWYWTVTYAAQRRLSVVGERSEGGGVSLGIFVNPLLVEGLALAVVGLLLARFVRRRWAPVAAIALLLAVHVLLFLHSNPLLAVIGAWSPLMDLALGMSAVLLVVRRRPTFVALLPPVLVATACAGFLSHGVFGSTFGIWPLLILLAGVVSLGFYELSRERPEWMIPVYAGAVGLGLTVLGALYVNQEARIRYADLPPGPVHRSTTPALAGLSTGGAYIPYLDRMLAYVSARVPADQSIVLLPGENPLYFALHRPPPIPVAEFEYTTDPYSVAQVQRMVRERRVRWLLVETHLQFVPGVPDYPELKAALTAGARLVASLPGYRLYALPPS